MARPLRIQFENALYHVTSRGNEKGEIFLEDRDRYVLLKLLKQVVERYEWVISAYCFMGNHYHLLVRTPNANLSIGMRQLNGVYAQYFNKQHERVGHLFQGRFSAILIKDEERLLTVARYIVLNPMRAGLVSNPADWRWSSYRCTAGIAGKSSIFDPDQILCFFSNKRGSACQQYINFVKEGIGGGSPLADARGGILAGEEELLELSIARLTGEIGDEVPGRERFADRPDLEKLFADNERDIGIYKAFCKYGYKLREIGEFLGLHYSIVSRIANRIDSD